MKYLAFSKEFQYINIAATYQILSETLTFWSFTFANSRTVRELSVWSRSHLSFAGSWSQSANWKEVGRRVRVYWHLLSSH